MIVLITIIEEGRLITSHGYDMKTDQLVVLPQDPPMALGGTFQLTAGRMGAVMIDDMQLALNMMIDVSCSTDEDDQTKRVLKWIKIIRADQERITREKMIKEGAN